MSDRHPFVELFLARLREFAREPEVIFWVFGFPILLAVGLGIAFRNKPPDEIVVGVVDASGFEDTLRALPPAAGFRAERVSESEGVLRLRLGKVAIVVVPGSPVEYRFDATRPESVFARQRVDDALQRAAGRADLLPVREKLSTEPGARYIDFLIPGLLGMNIMSGGMWGVGFVIVEMRSRKLLKRLIATPMRRGHFLGAMMASRMLMVFGEMILLLAFGWLVFGMVVQGPIWIIALLSLLGAFVFSGLGLLVASRARKIETVSGLMNLVMLPMFVLSGIFFSADRFPAAVQPFVKALPLTALNDALRAVILEGADLSSQWARLLLLAGWGAVSFFLALRVFRWT
ncbi:MAG TPA: ABC transporter permease [Planctomycetota bacterium]|jgi:ABC transporter DrrB family efflux protein|nr:ABC transporter permease [Planctomycetota bacterium]